MTGGQGHTTPVLTLARPMLTHTHTDNHNCRIINARFHTFRLVHLGPTDGPRVSYRIACPQLKRQIESRLPRQRQKRKKREWQPDQKESTIFTIPEESSNLMVMKFPPSRWMNFIFTVVSASIWRRILERLF